MHTQSVTLDYLPQYEAYGISDEKINVFEKQNIIPLISLASQDIEQLAYAPNTFPFLTKSSAPHFIHFVI